MTVYALRVEDVGHSMAFRRGEFVFEDDDLVGQGGSSSVMFDAFTAKETAEHVLEDMVRSNRGLVLKVVELHGD